MAEPRMVDIGNRLMAIGMTMQDFFDLEDAEDRAFVRARLRKKAADERLPSAHRQVLTEIADSLDK
jgi:hypothetical protein